MSYNKTTWQTGDVVTAEKLNNIENGIENAGGGGVFVIGFSDKYTLDKTWKEIHDAVSDGKFPFVIFIGGEEDEIGIGIVMSVYEDSGYYIDVMYNETVTYSAETENGYPTSASDDGGGDNGGGDVPT